MRLIILSFFICSSALATPSIKLVESIKYSDPELYAIAQIESNGGSNLKHPKVQYGLNKGHTAGGPFGMMPVTAYEAIQRDKALKRDYGHLLNLSPDKLTNTLNTRPRIALTLAQKEYKRRLKVLGNKKKVAYSWLYGVSGTLNTNKLDIDNSSYIKKYLRFLPRPVNNLN